MTAAPAAPVARKANRPDWTSAACLGADINLFITPDGYRDPVLPPDEALAYCEACPLKPECLDYALDRWDLVGVWGGTTATQRRHLRRRRSRKHCPGCSARTIARIDQGDEAVELCFGCGISWRAPDQG